MLTKSALQILSLPAPLALAGAIDTGGLALSLGLDLVMPPSPQLTYLPQPWGNCRAESELRDPELQGYSAYSVSACRLRCEKEAVLQRCHCRMVHMPGGHLQPVSGATPLGS